MVHVDDGEMGMLAGKDRLGFGQARGGAHDEQAVVQRELDEVDDQPAIMEDERTPRSRIGRGGNGSSHDCPLPHGRHHAVRCARKSLAPSRTV
jgi:hypothetical protein